MQGFDERQDIFSETILVSCRMSWFVQASIDTASQGLYKRAEQILFCAAYRVIAVDDHTCSIHVFPPSEISDH